MTQDFNFNNLKPHQVLNAIDNLGLECDGRLFELNSFENRVFQIGILDQAPVISKFYRPGRWTQDQIQEEHDFTLELVEHEIPAIAPMVIEGQSLFETDGYFFSLYKRQGGYAPELSIPQHLTSIGRTLGRMHALASRQLYQHRPSYQFDAMGRKSSEYLIENIIPEEHVTAYSRITHQILSLVKEQQTAIEKLPYLRLHGDCHLGNILWQDPTPFFVDFDDSINGPQIADLWLLFSVSDDEQYNRSQLNTLLEGYELFFEFDDAQLKYAEIFRVLRMMNYASWIGTRWEDPAFKKAFSWYNTETYWRDHIHDLQMQFKRMDQ